MVMEKIEIESPMDSIVDMFPIDEEVYTNLLRRDALFGKITYFLSIIASVAFFTFAMPFTSDTSIVVLQSLIVVIVIVTLVYISYWSNLFLDISENVSISIINNLNVFPEHLSIYLFVELHKKKQEIAKETNYKPIYDTAKKYYYIATMYEKFFVVTALFTLGLSYLTRYILFGFDKAAFTNVLILVLIIGVISPIISVSFGWKYDKKIYNILRVGIQNPRHSDLSNYQKKTILKRLYLGGFLYSSDLITSFQTSKKTFFGIILIVLYNFYEHSFSVVLITSLAILAAHFLKNANFFTVYYHLPSVIAYEAILSKGQILSPELFKIEMGSNILTKNLSQYGFFVTATALSAIFISLTFLILPPFSITVIIPYLNVALLLLLFFSNIYVSFYQIANQNKVHKLFKTSIQ